MSSGSTKNKNQNFKFEDKKDDIFLGVLKSSISFLSFSKKTENLDIYTKIKDIPIYELNPEFKRILKQEFTN
jgi:hypothetical protein